jgi:lysophospholipase L1-like esterase
MRRILPLLAAAFGLMAGSPAPAAHPSLPLAVALGDSITYGYRLPSPATQNYAALYAKRMNLRLDDLARPGYTCAEVANREIPQMPHGAAVVILYCGTNDIGGFRMEERSGPVGTVRGPSATDAELAAAEKDFGRVLAAIRVRDPYAAIYLLTVRHWQRMTGPEAPQFAKDVHAWNTMIKATGLNVVDVADDSRLYRSAYVLPDLLHPSVRGNDAIVSDFARGNAGD